MKFISIIVGIVFFIMLIKGVFESGLWAILVLVFIVISMVKDKNKKKRKKTKKENRKKITSTSKTSKTSKKNNNNLATVDFNLDSNDYKNTSKYQNESINQTAEFIKDKKKLVRLRQMKSLTLSNSAENNRANKLFYLQASFMDDFIDDYDVNVPFEKYLPTYNDLNIYQLRSFFSWRSLVRQGIYEQTSLSYVYLYIYELLNKIGVKNEIDGLNKLIELWQKYRIYDNSIDRYLLIWIKDYYIINQIKIDYKLIEEEMPVKALNNQQLISEIMLGNYENKLEFFDSISSYHILKSKIMEHKYSFLIEMLIPEIFKNLDKYFNENNLSFNSILFGELKKQTWVPYRSAIYYDNPLTKDFMVIFNDTEKYYKTKGTYLKETFEYSIYSKSLMGYILKNIDIILRECLHMPKGLKINPNMLENIEDSNKNLYNFIMDTKVVSIINVTIKKYLIEQKREINNLINKERKKAIVIDENKFASIRESSNRVQEKLIIEEEEPIIKMSTEEVTENIVISSDNIFVNLLTNLNALEIDFLKLLLNNEDKDNLILFCQKNNILYEIMLENINAKALDTIGDNLIEDCDSEVIIYAEYIDSLKDNIGGMKNE